MKVYIVDAVGAALIVYHNNYFMRLETGLFKFDENQRVITISDLEYNMASARLAMSLTPKTYPDQSQFLYFRPLASRDLYFIKTEDLKNIPKGKTLRFWGGKDVLSSQSIGQIFSSNGVLFFGMSKESGIACYNGYSRLESENIVSF